MKRQGTKERILEASLKLFSEKGIRETTIKDIAKEVGITEGAIYRHFTTKEGIVKELFRTYSEKFYNRLTRAVRSEGSYTDRFLKTVEAFLSFCFEYPSAFKYLNLFHYLRAGDVKEFSPLPKDAVVELLEEGIKEGVIRVRLEYALAMFVGTLERVFLLSEAGLLRLEEGLHKEVGLVLLKALI
ncbi:MAG: TetR/AcrR family transcriptional regulator [Aquificota bacterium]|nr:MAG: TetR/AcrR family transcriptional regulator [Aquificota bacterium]